MKGIIKIIILFLIFIYANNSKANTINIIYTVNNNPITNVEINNEITYLKLLSNDKEDRFKKGMAAFNRQRENFSIKKMKNSYKELYTNAYAISN